MRVFTTRITPATTGSNRITTPASINFFVYSFDNICFFVLPWVATAKEYTAQINRLAGRISRRGNFAC